MNWQAFLYGAIATGIIGTAYTYGYWRGYVAAFQKAEEINREVMKEVLRKYNG